ncbi:MAG: N-acetylmuramoyl-L-alanine amidase [Sandaracinaceae bacterium]|nr:N-acetylmuramoyl-L-alanine amidase [Sandaracinaceae bacterium]
MDTKHLTAALIVTLAAGCNAQLGSGTYQGHASQEMAASPEEIMGGSWHDDGEWLVSPTLDAPDGATRVGVFLGQSEPGLMPRVQARALTGGVPSGEWVDVSETWGEEDHHVGIAELGNAADGAQLRIARADAPIIQHLRWDAVIPDEGVEIEPETGDLGASREALRSELSGLGIVTRESWGARATRCTSANANKTRMAIHYTVTPSSNPERQVRGIQNYHMDSRGWCDVGYHFLVGTDGSIYEGRPLHLLGAHVGGNNTGNIGISFIGCFHPSGCSGMGPTTPPEAMINAGGRLLGHLSRLYGIDLDGTHVKGHRDHSGASTSCPGDYLHRRIGDMLAIGRSGTTPPPAPSPAPTPSPTPSPSPSGASCTHSYGGTYGDMACSSGYQCCDGRWRVRGSSSACGACACVEGSGSTGCSAGSTPAPAPTPTAPAGASCGHTYGGTYANTACSAGYQCCDGRWRVRGSSSACGACFCTEASGSLGCGT